MSENKNLEELSEQALEEAAGGVAQSNNATRGMVNSANTTRGTVSTSAYRKTSLDDTKLTTKRTS
jgi:hypothetical protein